MRILLWLFVITLGVAFGAGVFEHRILIPHWLSTAADGARHWNADVVLAHDTGRRFWAFVTSVPLTLLTLISLVAAWRLGGEAGRWWLVAAGLALVDRVSTFAYFIPTMIGLMETPDTPAAVSTASVWSALNYGRHVVVFAAWLMALRAFAAFYAEGPRASGSERA